MPSVWKNIWSVPIKHLNDEWVRVIKRSCECLQPIASVSITPENVKKAVCSTPNWKSPRPDELHNIWLSNLVLYRKPEEKKLVRAYLYRKSGLHGSYISSSSKADCLPCIVNLIYLLIYKVAFSYKGNKMPAKATFFYIKTIL